MAVFIEDYCQSCGQFTMIDEQSGTCQPCDDAVFASRPPRAFEPVDVDGHVFTRAEFTLAV